MAQENITGPIDCACVIHGTAYTWDYVDRLYSMLSRHISTGIRLHVYTEAHRTVPEPYIKHSLLDWGSGGPTQSWWYKMQLFNPKQYRGPLLYFDLDTVIVKNIDWIHRLPLDYFWTIRDFKYLWKPNSYSINSSIMWFNTAKFNDVWDNFRQLNIAQITAKYRGDQDYITEAINLKDRRFFDINQIKSWRWECLDGGYEFAKKRHLLPNTGTVIPHTTSVLVFHGHPKPAEILDTLVVQHWQ